MNEDNNPEIGPVKETGLGDLLKTEREKKGLSINQIAGITRLRKHFIEALENEEWEKLPAKVFVKGFIRSYALSVDLDVNEALRVFEIYGPQEEEADFSKTLITAEKKKSKIIYLIILLLALAGIIFYFIMGWDWNISNVVEPEVTPIHVGNRPGNTETAGTSETPGPVIEDYPAKNEVNQNSETTETDLSELPLEEDTGESSQTEINSEDIKEVIQEKDAVENETSVIQIYPSDLITGEEAARKDLETDDSGLVLTGIVDMRTYVKIFVDDNPPKEYIFRPGSRPQWSGEKGFYVIVGNAAGIEFDFNGTIIGNLGRPGSVKNLRFPDEFRSEWEE
jgi:cytoskeletal protein RodZ